jgi:hypothetical protein
VLRVCDFRVGGVNITTNFAIIAIGNHTTQIFVFPRLHFKKHAVTDAPTASVTGAKLTNCSNEYLFFFSPFEALYYV